MPLTSEQAERIEAYYEARNPYNELLFEALADAPPNQPHLHPMDALKAKKKPAAETKQPGDEVSTDAKPGDYFQELVGMLREHRISSPEEGKDGPAAKK